MSDKTEFVKGSPCVFADLECSPPDGTCIFHQDKTGVPADAGRAGDPSDPSLCESRPSGRSSLTHTQGPWHVADDRPIGGRVCVVAEDGSEICSVEEYDVFEVEADAHLIAAAPDLLEALKSYFAHDWCEKIGMWEEVAQAVISRAEGRVSDGNPEGENPKGSSAEGMTARCHEVADARLSSSKARIETLEAALKEIEQLALGPDRGSAAWQAKCAHDIACFALRSKGETGDAS